MKDMDSVFADCTEKELAFDVMFDQDDSLIDIVAGVNEAGDFVTGNDLVFKEEDDLVGEKPDFDYNDDGDASYSLNDAEGSKHKNLRLGGEVGDREEVSGKENSAEANAYDTTDEEEAIGMNDKRQTSLESFDAFFEKCCNEDDEVEIDNSEDNDAEAELESFFKGFDTFMKVNEDASVCPCCGQEYCDCAEREGEVKHDTSDVEGQSTSPVGAALDDADADFDPIEDEDDWAEREGEVKHDTSEVEGQSTEVVGASFDEAADFIDSILRECELDEASIFVNDLLNECEDLDARQGNTKCCSDVEGQSTSPIGAALDDADADFDPIEDEDDWAEREGEVKHDTSEVEGQSTEVVGASFDEAAEELFNDLEYLLKDVEVTDDKLISDEINVNEDTEIDLVIEDSAAEEKDIEADEVDEDDLIELVDSDDDSSADLTAGYDDDELIDLVISGKED